MSAVSDVGDMMREVSRWSCWYGHFTHNIFSTFIIISSCIHNVSSGVVETFYSSLLSQCHISHIMMPLQTSEHVRVCHNIFGSITLNMLWCDWQELTVIIDTELWCDMCWYCDDDDPWSDPTTGPTTDQLPLCIIVTCAPLFIISDTNLADLSSIDPFMLTASINKSVDFTPSNISSHLIATTSLCRWSPPGHWGHVTWCQWCKLKSNCVNCPKISGITCTTTTSRCWG